MFSFRAMKASRPASARGVVFNLEGNSRRAARAPRR